MEDNLEQYIGKVFVADTTLHLPTGHIAEPGTSFKLLAAHLAGGIRPDLWLVAGNAHLAQDQNVRLTPAGPKPAEAPTAKAAEKTEAGATTAPGK